MPLPTSKDLSSYVRTVTTHECLFCDEEIDPLTKANLTNHLIEQCSDLPYIDGEPISNWQLGAGSSEDYKEQDGWYTVHIDHDVDHLKQKLSGEFLDDFVAFIVQAEDGEYNQILGLERNYWFPQPVWVPIQEDYWKRAVENLDISN